MTTLQIPRYSFCIASTVAILLQTASSFAAEGGSAANSAVEAQSISAARGSGAIEGRVFDARRGQYLENARVSIEGTTLETFTDAGGQYRFTAVPAGTIRVKVFYTGAGSQMDTTVVEAGKTLEYNINLGAGPGVPGPGDDILKLDDFIVSSSREMEGAAIAINEQRFASNIVNAVSAEEFGTIVDGSVGEFMKFLPGIVSDYTGGDARRFSINGVPAANVPITIGGFDLASASGTTDTGRAVELDQVSINNIARIEVLHSPTPESPGAALAGSVNMVPRSAFERSKPVFNYSVHLQMKDDEKTFRKTPGPAFEKTRKIHPGFDFSAIVPVNKNFGFTLSGGYSVQYTALPATTMSWAGASFATNGTTLPHTTPDQPYLAQYVVRASGKDTTRYSFGSTIDYRFSRYDRLSFSFQYAFLGEEFVTRNQTFIVQDVKPGAFGQTFTHGTAGRGEVRLNNTGRIRPGATIMPTLTYRHDGPVWKLESGLGFSQSRMRYQDMDKGFFNATQARRSGVTISFDDINYLRPGTITVTDAAGAPVDPNLLANYSLGTNSGTRRDNLDERRTAFVNLRRDLQVRDIPVTLKSGLDFRHLLRDHRGESSQYSFVGEDGRASTTPVSNDDSAGLVLDEVYSQRDLNFGFAPVQWESGKKLWELYQARPEYFLYNESASYIATMQASKRIEELVSSAYLRADADFLNRRLKIVGGLRAEQTNIDSEGPLNDRTLNYQRDASGNVIDGNATTPGVQPVLIVPTSNALGVAKLTRISRGTHATKEYLTLFPSINVSYRLRENLIGRAAYYTSIGRPNLNQYASGITMPDPDALPSPSNQFATENIGVKPWTAQTYKVRFEYYFEKVGALSVGGFLREFDNFIGSTVTRATPEFLDSYGLDPAVYDQYDVSTKYNMSNKVRMTGAEFDYKQALSFLPAWARGVQVFANASVQRVEGENVVTSNFSGFVPFYANWGVSLTRPKYNFRINWNYRGANRRGAITAAGIESGTYNYSSKRLYIDVSGEYYIRKWLATFVAIRNLHDAPEDVKIYGPNTPAWARFNQRASYGALWSCGVKGRF